jgi:6-phosphogluconolactonase
LFNAFPQPEARLLVFEDPTALAREAARRVVAGAGRAVEAGAMCRIALSGGRTPLEAYRTLAADPYVNSVHWDSVELFWSDERFVPHEHADSNYGAARAALLGALPMRAAQVHPIPTDTVNAHVAAIAYQNRLRRVFGIEPPGVPRFDLVLLGLGEDGHTASLFPGRVPPPSPELLVTATEAPGGGPARVSLTLATLNSAHAVLFLVSGAAKAEALERTLKATEPDPQLPATLIRLERGKPTWLVDRAAAGRLDLPSAAEVRPSPGSGPEP